MKEDKILKKIHQIQARLHQKHRGLSWNQEARLMDRIAKKVAKKYNYQIFPVAKTPYALSRQPLGSVEKIRAYRDALYERYIRTHKKFDIHSFYVKGKKCTHAVPKTA